MSNIISYNFPFDSLENQQVINSNKDIKVSSSLSSSRIDFDKQRGSFLSLLNNNSISFAFDAFTIDPDKLYVINLFFNYELLSNGPSDDPFLKIDDKYGLSIQNNILFLNTDPSEKLVQNTWYNVTITVSRGKIKTFLFNKEIGSATIFLEGIKKMKLQGGTTSNIKFSDLSIQEEVNASALEKIRNHQDVNHRSVFSTINFQLYNKAEYKNRLFLEEDGLTLFLDIDFGKYLVEFDFTKEEHIILKAKKGFFKQDESGHNAEHANNGGDDFCIRLKADPATVKDHKISIPILHAELVNLRNQDQVLVQLELHNCTLKTADNEHIPVSGDQSIKIDQTIPIQDNLGSNLCPFDVFILGNDTLYNGSNYNIDPQTITLRLINNTFGSIAFGQNSSFEITSSQMEILRHDVLQTANIKVKSREAMELKTLKEDKLKVCLAEEAIIAKNQWIDIEISGLQAETASTRFPSGSYPFDLEYRNIRGYRSGKTKFHIKTGKIFYSNK